MEKGVSKYWTPGKELEFEERIKRCQTFAERDLLMSIRDLLKYDLRTREGKRAIAQARLRTATATDKDIEEVAALQVWLEGKDSVPAVLERQDELKKIRARIREKGIKRSELACQ